MKSARWIAGPSDGATLRDVLPRLGAFANRAVEDGRAFVDGVRAVTGAIATAPGTMVEVYERRVATGEVQILDDRDGIVVASKPAPMATEPDQGGRPAAVTHAVAARLGVPAAEVHAAGRLDVGVSGVVVLAIGVRGRATLARSKIAKRYVAILAQSPHPEQGAWTEAVAGRPAHTAYVTLARVPTGAALVEARPSTGRHHQIRVHTAGAGTPIFGDQRRRGPARHARADGSVVAVDRILLHAESVSIDDGREQRIVRAPIDPALVDFWTAAGGSPAAFRPRDP